MSRKEINNPSVRMGRVLDDYDELEAAYMEMSERFSEANPEAFMKCSAKPLAEAVINERARRQYTLAGVRAARERMRRVRSGQPQDSQLSTPRVTRGAVEKVELSPEVQAEIMAEAERLAEVPEVFPAKKADD